MVFNQLSVCTFGSGEGGDIPQAMSDTGFCGSRRLYSGRDQGKKLTAVCATLLCHELVHQWHRVDISGSSSFTRPFPDKAFALERHFFAPGNPGLTDQQLLWPLSRFCTAPCVPVVSTSAATPTVLLWFLLPSFSNDFVQDALCSFHRKVPTLLVQGKESGSM